MAVCGHFLLFCTLPSQGQSCRSATINDNSVCQESSSACERQHLNEDLDLCAIVDNPDYDYDYLACEDCTLPRLNERDEATLRRNPIEIVSVEIKSIGDKYFSINVSWHHTIDFNIGYKIYIQKDERNYFPYCACNNEKNVDIIDIWFTYTKHMARMQVRIEPLIDGDHVVDAVMKTTMWPSSCLEAHHYDSSTCGSPVLIPPQNITASQVCTTSMNDHLTVELKWDYMVDKFSPPSHYYIEAKNVSSVNSSNSFRFVANGTKKVYLQLPNSHYIFYVKAYRYCSGGGNYTNSDVSFGCGEKSKPVSLTLCPDPTPSKTETFTTPENRRKPPIYLYIAVSCGGIVFLLVFIVVAVVVYHIVRRKKKPKIPFVTTGFPRVDCSVFVVHTPQDNSMKDLQTYVICPLRECFDVATTGDIMCGDIIEWIELQVRQRSAILLVFTKEFCSEWEGSEDKSHVVQAARHLLTSAVAQELLDKYAIVVLDEDAKKKYIPNNHFLKSMGVYVLGRKKNEIESLYRFITKTKSFEHKDEPPSTFGSSTCSSDFTSQHTDSTGANLTPSSSEYISFGHPNKESGIKNEKSTQEHSREIMNSKDDVCNQSALMKILDIPGELGKPSIG